MIISLYLETLDPKIYLLRTRTHLLPPTTPARLEFCDITIVSNFKYFAALTHCRDPKSSAITLRLIFDLLILGAPSVLG